MFNSECFSYSIYIDTWLVYIVFGAEHILILIALLLQWAISPVPEWVRIRIARRNYLEQMRILHIAKRK